MTEDEASKAAFAAFVTGWPLAVPDVPFALENEALPSADRFVHVTFQHTGSRLLTQGGRGARRVERTGWIVVKLWSPAGEGRSGANVLAQAVRGIFELADLPGAGGESVTTLATVPLEVGVDGRWFMMLMRTPFRYYATA